MNFHACIGPVVGIELLMAGAVAEARTLCTRNGISTGCEVIKGNRPNHHVITWTDPQSSRESWTFAHGGANNVWVTTPYAENIREEMSWVDPGTYRVIRVDFTTPAGRREAITYPSPR